jgi:hypothetical protein
MNPSRRFGVDRVLRLPATVSANDRVAQRFRLGYIRVSPFWRLEKGPSGMNRSYLLPVMIAAIFVAGCASTEPNSAEPRSEKRYVTGSRIPAPEGNTSANVKSIESKEGIDDAMQGRTITVPGKGGTQ